MEGNSLELLLPVKFNSLPTRRLIQLPMAITCKSSSLDSFLVCTCGSESDNDCSQSEHGEKQMVTREQWAC